MIWLESWGVLKIKAPMWIVSCQDMVYLWLQLDEDNPTEISSMNWHDIDRVFVSCVSVPCHNWLSKQTRPQNEPCKMVYGIVFCLSFVNCDKIGIFNYQEKILFLGQTNWVLNKCHVKYFKIYFRFLKHWTWKVYIVNRARSDYFSCKSIRLLTRNCKQHTESYKEMLYQSDCWY